MKSCEWMHALLLILVLSPALSYAQGSGVLAWEGTITIPTYELGTPDPNPPFPLVNSKPVYPYTMLDDLTDQHAPKTYRAIYLENDFLKVTILPQLGGRVYSVYDKTNDREVLYRNSVIKYGLVAARGAWFPGGMEFSFPFAHTTDSVSTVESALSHGVDGSATASIGAVDRVSNMYWQVTLTLRPNTARLEEGVTLFNSTPVDHLYLFWTNAAVKVTPDLQYIYPMRETISDDPFAIVQSWPMRDGVNDSWHKNMPSQASIFGRDVHRNYFGVYYHQSNYGVVHVADYHQDPGKKIFTRGTGPQGKIRDHLLSDDDSSDTEIQSGRHYTQGFREFIDPYRVEKWTEYWYPVRGLDDGFVEATSDMAVNITYPGRGKDQPAEMKLTVSPVADIRGASLTVKAGPKLLRELHLIHLVPLQPISWAIPVADIDTVKGELEVEIQSAAGKTLLHWSAASPVDGNTDFVPSAGTALKKKISITPQTPLQDLYLQGVFLQKRGDLQEALKIYDQVLDRDSGYVPALIKKASYFYEAMDLIEAEHLLARARQRNNEDPVVAYTSGLVYRAGGKMGLAKASFRTSIRYSHSLPPGSSLAPAYEQLGELEIREGNYANASRFLRRAIECDPEDALALADLAVAERLSGNTREATTTGAEAVRKMALLPYALVEQWQDGQTSGLTTANQNWVATIRSDPDNFIAAASWYHALGAWKSSDAVLQIAMNSLPPMEISPLFYYYLASNARQEGEAVRAKQYANKAGSLPIADVFPNRIADAEVLREAIQKDQADSHPKYALGNFFFAHGQYEKAADLWSQALLQGFNSPVLLRNLGVYQWHVKKDLASAADDYRRAILMSPNDFRLYTDLDKIYEQQDDAAERTKLFRSAPVAVLSQDTVRARHAILLIEESQPDQALALLADHQFEPTEGAVAFYDLFVAANLEKGKILLDKNQPTQAEDAFRRAMQYPPNLGIGEPVQPDTAEQLYFLGTALQAQGKAGEALSVWRDAAAQRHTGVSAVFSALSYEKLGQKKQAQQILEQCIQAVGGPDATAKDYLAAGIAERYGHRPEIASKDFNGALQLDPLFWQVRVALGQDRSVGQDPK
jgi:tetratricopeptide (TPR) repeat protein